MRNSEIRRLAREQLRGNVLNFFIISIVATIATAITLAVPVVGNIFCYIVISPLLRSGYAGIYMNLSRGQNPQVSDLIMYKEDIIRASITACLSTALITAGFFFFVIPGIILTYAVSMSFFIFTERPDLSPFDVLKKSSELMRGHKMSYFFLIISFFPWYILSAITFGLASIYVVPYVGLSTANFYNSIKAQAQQTTTS